MTVPKGEADGIIAICTFDAGKRWHVLALMSRCATSRRSGLGVSDLAIAVSTPTVDVTVVPDGTGVEITCNK